MGSLVPLLQKLLDKFLEFVKLVFDVGEFFQLFL